MKYSRVLLLVLGVLSATNLLAEELYFSGVVDEVLDDSVFGDDIQPGDSIDARVEVTLDPFVSFVFLDGDDKPPLAGDAFVYAAFPDGTVDAQIGQADPLNCSLFASVIGDNYVSEGNQDRPPFDLFFSLSPCAEPGYRFTTRLLSNSGLALDTAAWALPTEDVTNVCEWDEREWRIERLDEDLDDFTPLVTGTIRTIGRSEIDLKELIEGIRDEESDLPAGLANALAKSAENALAKIQSGNPRAAANMLKALINKVEAQSGKKIPADGAAEGIATIGDIIDSLPEDCSR